MIARGMSLFCALRGDSQGRGMQWQVERGDKGKDAAGGKATERTRFSSRACHAGVLCVGIEIEDIPNVRGKQQRLDATAYNVGLMQRSLNEEGIQAAERIAEQFLHRAGHFHSVPTFMEHLVKGAFSGVVGCECDFVNICERCTTQAGATLPWSAGLFSAASCDGTRSSWERNTGAEAWGWRWVDRIRWVGAKGSIETS